jgi:hypothetical protein
MNLSSRLDEARRRREQGEVDKVDRHPLDLRYATEEGQTYDGRALRTGEELTADRWAELRDGRDHQLPTWTPEPGSSFADSAGLIDLTDVGPAVAPPETAPLPTSSEPAIELPKWANEKPLDIDPAATSPAGRATGSCVNCGGDPRVDVFDMVSGIAHLECTGCGFKWQAVTEHRLPPKP